MVFLKNLYYNVNVSEVQNTPVREKQNLRNLQNLQIL